MKKFSFLFSIIILLLLTSKSFAKTCEQETPCHTVRGCHGLYPGGATTCNDTYCSSSVTSDPIINPASYCSNRVAKTSVLATNAWDDCSIHRNLTYNYCLPGRGPKAIISGDLYVYSTYNFNVVVNGRAVTARPTGTLVGRVTEGSDISITLAMPDFYGTPGWMYNQNTPLINAVFANGQVVTSAQNWSDDIEYTEGVIYNYSTYDFDDMTIVLGIKNDEPPKGFLETQKGFSYIGGNNNQPDFSTLRSFSTNVFASKNAIGTQVPSCAGTLCSSLRYLTFDYADANTLATGLTWYSYLKNPLLNNVDLNKIERTSTSYSAVSPSLLSDKTNLVVVNGDFSATGQCSKTNVFLISGNLTITPNFTVAANPKDACLFIVGGTTRVLQSASPTIVCASLTTNNSANVPSLRDSVDAFIITKNFTTDASSRQLLIKGGLVTDTFIGGAKGLNRNVNTQNCRYPNLASERIDYEGARYVKNFGNVLNEPMFISVFEGQYKSAN
jgi:hypothetical protein